MKGNEAPFRSQRCLELQQRGNFYILIECVAAIGELFFKFSTDVEEIEMFEITKRIAVKQDKNGNHFCIAHSSLSIASFRGV